MFTLHRDEDAARQETFNPSLKLLLLFDQTVRGLKKRAPVEFRGIPIGRVADISFDLVPDATDKLIPVLIEIDPALMRPEAARKLATPDAAFLKDAVSKGLRASLKTGSLITGALFVDLDYYEDDPAELGTVGEFTSIPTVSSGFAQLEAKLTAIMDKIQAVPLDKIGRHCRRGRGSENHHCRVPRDAEGNRGHRLRRTQDPGGS
jgi:paraquat-inducible protein B